MSDDYVTLHVTLRQLRPNAVRVDADEAGESTWIPRANLHAADDTALESAAMDSEITLRVREWFCLREGLI